MDALRLLSRSTGLKPPSSKATGLHLPSEGQHGPAPTEVAESKKRKRGSEDEAGGAGKVLTDQEIRSLQKQYKIRIVNLRLVHKQKSSKTKKQQKESARLYPQPLTAFAQLESKYGISKALKEKIKSEGYYEPTEVQIATLPLLLEDVKAGPDLLTVAPTGSGKTLAFLIPLIEKVRKCHQEEGEKRDRHVQAIILAPTKELVGQIVNESRKLCTNTGVTITEMRKGMKLSEDINATDGDDGSDEDEDKRTSSTKTIVKSDIIVSTPLSLVHSILLRDEASTVQLPQIKTLILDEADVLLDPLFRMQTLQIWSSLTSPILRASLWSATIGSSIEELAINTIKSRRKALALSSKKPPILRCVIGLKDSSLPTINHRLVYAATEPGKLLGIRQLLHPSSSSAAFTSLRPPFLIFTQTISRATALHEELKFDIPASAGRSSRIAVLHSDLSSTKRSDIMARFRKGEIWVLITTDLLSRGVDFRGVNGVVNYDIPTTSASYVHRAGRTGRAGREGGVCVTFYTREDVKYLKAVASVIKASQALTPSSGKGAVKLEGIEKWMLDALPELSKKDRKELKERGVEERRAVKESDGVEERRKKRKNRVGTRSGYERREETRRKGMVEGSRRRKEKDVEEEGVSDGGDDFGGFD